MKLRDINWVGILLAIALLLCLTDMPYGYYTFIRYATTIYSLILAVKLWSRKKILAWICIVIAFLFNPFLKVVLGRDGWTFVDIVVAIYYVVICGNVSLGHFSKIQAYLSRNDFNNNKENDIKVRHSQSQLLTCWLN